MKKGENVPLKKKRGLGTDVAVISSMMFVAQVNVLYATYDVRIMYLYLNNSFIIDYHFTDDRKLDRFDRHQRRHLCGQLLQSLGCPHGQPSLVHGPLEWCGVIYSYIYK